MSGGIYRVGGRTARIEDKPSGRNLYPGTYTDDGQTALFLHSGGHWIEHTDDQCSDCRTGVYTPKNEISDHWYSR